MNKIVARLGLSVLTAGLAVVVAMAQQETAKPADASSLASSDADQTAALAANLYHIGPGDVLGIRVSAGEFVPELSIDSVEVDECGRIPLPSVQFEKVNEIQAAGLTRLELAANLRKFYIKYKKNPQVLVTIKGYNSQPVVVQGAVAKPAQFQLRRSIRLFELIQFHAGGATNKAGGRVQIARLPNFFGCGPISNQASAQTDSAQEEISFLSVDLREMLRGMDTANPYLQPGDVVTVLEAKQAYLIGNVLSPGAILLNEEKLTVSQAIARAGGTLPDAKKDKVRIIRTKPGTNEREELFVNLNAINESLKSKGGMSNQETAGDLVLQPDDIVEVPVSAGKRLLRTLAGAVVPGVSNLPVRVIP